MNYNGIKTIILNEHEMAKLYSGELSLPGELNQYLIIQNLQGKDVDVFKIGKQQLEQVPTQVFKSEKFGTFKPKNNDPYQKAYIDSISHNQLTIATGPAGSGKTYAALAYAFSQLERGTISKIIIFTNTVPAYGASRLGAYPGTKDAKLLDLSIGHILGSKLGSSVFIQDLIEKEQLILIPMCDARGYETPEDSFVYFTEAQNMNKYLIKLFLQRIGDSSKVVIEGDLRQTDDQIMFGHGENGLRRAIDVFAGKDYFGHVELKNIYRSRIAADAEAI